MVCQVTSEKPSVPDFSSFQDNGTSRKRMQQSSSGARQQAEGNRYTPFPTRSSGGSCVGRVGAHSASLPSCAVSADGRGGSRGGPVVESRPDRQQGITPRPEALGLQVSTPLLTSPASLLPLAISTSLPSDHSTSSSDSDSCTLVTFHTTSNLPPPCPLSCRPSGVYLSLYRQLPVVTSDVDLERLARSMHGLQAGCFYYPDLDSNGARSMLRKAPEGTFLVRDSSDPKYLFSISVKTARGATSVRIYYSSGFFQLDCDNHMKRKLPRFETLLDLLDFHMTVCQEQQGAQYRWQEGPHRMDMVIRLTNPRRHAPPSLAHLARVSVNRSLQDLHLPHRSTDLLPVPDALKQFLRGYPFKV